MPTVSRSSSDKRPAAKAARRAASEIHLALADLLIDCVEGGASVSFMLPMTRDKALHFWRKAADSAARGERILLVAEDEAGIAGTVQESFRVGRRVMSFDEYLALYARDPARQGRDASPPRKMASTAAVASLCEPRSVARYFCQATS